MDVVHLLLGLLVSLPSLIQAGVYILELNQGKGELIKWYSDLEKIGKKEVGKWASILKW